MRAFFSRQLGHAFKFVLTGHECEAVFMLVSICLPGLVDTELSVLNAARAQTNTVVPDECQTRFPKLST